MCEKSKSTTFSYYKMYNIKTVCCQMLISRACCVFLRWTVSVFKHIYQIWNKCLYYESKYGLKTTMKYHLCLWCLKTGEATDMGDKACRICPEFCAENLVPRILWWKSGAENLVREWFWGGCRALAIMPPLVDLVVHPPVLPPVENPFLVPASFQVTGLQ